MSSPNEVQRIRKVYAERDRRGVSHSKAAAWRIISEDRHARMRKLVGEDASRTSRLLDVGCGSGWDIEMWTRAGWSPDRLAGVDVVASRVDAARERCPGVDIRLIDGDHLPFDDDAFDVTTAATVFSSILDQRVRQALFAEMLRVTRQGGLVLVYDFTLRNPRNPHVLAMTRRRLAELGRPPDRTARLTPLVQLVAAGSMIHPRLTALAMRFGPRTHRLSVWVPA